MIKENKFKRLYFDIETSPNLVFSWNTGYNIKIDYDNIIEERAIICICYKWEGEDKVYSLQWNKGDDKQMILDFVKIINSADEIVGHNSDNFDIKWFRTRALWHGVKALPKFKSIDTLKIARSKFRFNSNRLDYISKYLGYGGKIKTEFDLWKKIVLNNDKTAMKYMVDYCKKDVILLEKIHKKLEGFSEPKTNVAVFYNQDKCDCPYCGSVKTHIRKKTVSALGTVKYNMQCQNEKCGKYYTVSSKAIEERFKD